MAYVFNPTYVHQTVAAASKQVITAERWNELFNLLITQGDNTVDAIKAFLTDLNTDGADNVGAVYNSVQMDLQSVLNLISAAIAARYTSTEVNTAITVAKNGCVTGVTYDGTQGKFTINKGDGTNTVIDTNIEKIPASLALVNDAGTTYLVVTNTDGSTTRANVSSLVNNYTFNGSACISVTASGSGETQTFTFSVPDGSITNAKLAAEVMSTIIGYKDAAATSASAAASSASTATTKASDAATSASAAATSATSASNSASTATTKATAANTSATNAANSATAAAGSASAAATSATTASNAATSANNSKIAAATSETNAASSATTATTKATNASDSATAAANSATAAATSAAAASADAASASASADSMGASVSTCTNSANAASASATAAAKSAADAAISASQAAAGQINTDWNETDVTSKAFLKNKPDVATKSYVNTAISMWQVPDNSLTTVKLADKAVTTAKLDDGSVTNEKISDRGLAHVVGGTLHTLDGEEIQTGMRPRIVVTAHPGSTVTCHRGSTTLTVPEINGTWTFDVPDYGTWTITATLGEKSAETTIDVSAVQLYSANILYLDSVFANNDWWTIRKAVDYGMVPASWNVGDSKTIVLNGTMGTVTLNNFQCSLQIVAKPGFNSAREGSNILHLRFASANGTKGLAFCDNGYDSITENASKFNMNPTNVNTGGFWASTMNTGILGNTGTPAAPTAKSLMSCLPQEVRDVMVQCTKYNDNTGGGANTAAFVTAKQYWIALPAEFEVFGASTYANSAEKNYQQQYPFFAAGNSKIHYCHNALTFAVNAWGRSVNATGPDDFELVSGNGTANNYAAYYSCGVPPLLFI